MYIYICMIIYGLSREISAIRANKIDKKFKKINGNCGAAEDFLMPKPLTAKPCFGSQVRDRISYEGPHEPQGKVNCLHLGFRVRGFKFRV